MKTYDDFFKESDCDGRGTYRPDSLEEISGIRSHGPMISVEKANRIIRESAKNILYNIADDVFQFESSGEKFEGKRTVRGAILWMEAKDSPEDVLKDMLRRLEKGYSPDISWDTLKARAKRFVGEI